jgi:ABC-type Fe3+/spermidine/putrescine transport system ATPase subunit
MARLNFRRISKRFGAVVAVDDVTLDIGSGEFLTLVGASGCGKTTLLRIIAGFARADSGELAIDGRRVEGLPPSRREVGFVFQSYALFPTQTVAGNIGFSLRIRRRPKAEIAARVAELCALTQLEALKDRYPHELSGGQQQRVALARALAPHPTILLLDEPLSALDAKIRAHLRSEIRAVVDRLGITTVYVTHDQEEALSISDRVAVMEAGRILQVGAPMDVYLRPCSRFVADFIGTSNDLIGRPLGNGRLEIEGRPIKAQVPETLRRRDRCVVCVRPEHIELSRPAGDAGAPTATLTGFSFLGQAVRAHVCTENGRHLVADVAAVDWLANDFAKGDTVAWTIRADSAIVFAADEEAAPSPLPEGQSQGGS